MRTEAARSSGTPFERRQAGRVAVSSTRALIDAIGRADTVALGTYALRRNSDLVIALEDAARRGARVHVRIGRPYRDDGDLEARNQAAIDDLSASGVDVTKTDTLEHLKAAVVDGEAFLDDRNWTTGGPETVIVDSRPSDVAAVRKALERGIPPRATDTFTVGKRDAQRLESDLIATSRTTLDVESETLTTDSRVEDALLFAARRECVRLIVSRDGASDPKERAALEQLARNGVAIRIGDAESGIGNEKFCVTGRRSWVGSANATFVGRGPGSLDWGLRTNARSIASALHERFEKNWNRSPRFVA